MLKYRVLTAIVLLLIIFSMMWLLKPPLFSAVIAIFFIISAAEWAGLMGIQSYPGRVAYVILMVLLLFVAYYLPPAPWFYAAFILWLWAAAAVYSYQRGGSLLGFEQPWLKGLSGLLMFVACWKGLSILQAFSPVWVLMVLSICWLADTGAYFTGRRWGCHALASRISPKKTWEGFWGGVILTVAVLSGCSFFLSLTGSQRGLLIVLIVVCTLFAVVGDLFVSLLKRQAGLKDSGNILPGHGGLLDRVDSTISSVPIFALGFLLLR